MTGQGGRRHHKLEALGKGAWCSEALIQGAATNPLRAGSNADLIAHPVIPQLFRAGGMRAVPVVIAGRGGVGAATAPAQVYRVMPVIIVVGGNAVPASVFGLQCVMRPAHPGIESPTTMPCR